VKVSVNALRHPELDSGSWEPARESESRGSQDPSVDSLRSSPKDDGCRAKLLFINYFFNNKATLPSRLPSAKQITFSSSVIGACCNPAT
jgi:hypothetical protein